MLRSELARIKLVQVARRAPERRDNPVNAQRQRSWERDLAAAAVRYASAVEQDEDEQDQADYRRPGDDDAQA